ncbi:Transcriptional regulator, contains XRE-family HTH domain [Fulvimarina manganoxydans]|uniref:Transcriptional regulator, contains XRE-family HTH domain n=1 Tax=Fulvimarina manganoxydans TaxID=937218 RepID=A0A1W2ACN2_9HYPH|nr:helix-turn-helix transcriptional regulator [Fulvimarina manganoxydans]SMC58353.1 Transcriptional regulator, contains XRE-family HTH domain [Fulvimarina manganoxydans]
MTTLSDRLRLVREARDLTQSAIARAAGVDLRTVRAYEAAEKAPSAPTLVRLAGVLGVSVDWLLGLVDEHTGHASAEKLVPGLSRLDARDLETVSELVGRFLAAAERRRDRAA